MSELPVEFADGLNIQGPLIDLQERLRIGMAVLTSVQESARLARAATKEQEARAESAERACAESEARAREAEQDWQQAMRDAQGREIDLRQELDASVDEAYRLCVEHGRINAELTEQLQQVARLQAQLDAVYRSTSWRISGPIRATRLGAHHMLRWSAHRLRPMLRTVTQWTWLRWPVVALLGRNSKLVAHSRLFLFGAPTLAPPAAMSVADADPILRLDARARRIHQLIRGVVSPGSDEETR